MLLLGPRQLSPAKQHRPLSTYALGLGHGMKGKAMNKRLPILGISNVTGPLTKEVFLAHLSQSIEFARNRGLRLPTNMCTLKPQRVCSKILNTRGPSPSTASSIMPTELGSQS